MLKRKLPQWLLDATNNNEKCTKPNTPEPIRKHSNKTSNDQSSTDTDNYVEDHSNRNNEIESNQVADNVKISIVPLSNLLSPSRGGIPTTSTSNDTEIDDGGTREIENDVTSLPVAVNTVEQQVTVKQEIKDEPVDPDEATSNAPSVAPVQLVPKVENVKPERRSCNFGIKCFRRNPDHRKELAHPGDVDYRRPDFPTAPIGTPPCPWGAACYRRNPQHFIQLSHPPATNSATTNVNTVPQSNQPQRRNRIAVSYNRLVDDSDAEDDYDLDDPFIDDGSSDEYVPDGDGSDDDDDMEDTQESKDD